MAVAIADGAETISDVQALADQPALHGPVASTATIWRVLDGVDADLLDGLRLARASVRERAWAARGELTGAELPPARAAGRDLNYAVIDIDATLVTAHSDKEGAAGNFKGGWGYHPIGAWLDNTGEALAAILRPGNSGSNTAADHIAVLDLALAQLPDAHRGKPILIRVDGAGFSHSLIEHLAASGLGYSVGFPTNGSVRAAIGLIPAWVWRPAVDAVGGVRDGADVAEITGLLTLGGWPAGMRVIVRRERPHPGAQLDAFEARRLPLPSRVHQHPKRVDPVPGGPAPRPRPGRGPDPLRQGHRHRPLPIQGAGDQRRLAGDVVDRDGPAGLGPDHAPRRPRTGPGRAEETALPATAHRSPDHPRTTTHLPPPGQELAVGIGPRPSVHPTPAHPATGLNTDNAPTRTTSETPANAPEPRDAAVPNAAATPSVKIISTVTSVLLKDRG